ncbi:HNH endonuclease family protein [Isoptericola sp. AK164]|uniref:HNH endonuclease family protein n=1 Tax=Isoptericola sp. AK164 TaxID=3024246 RepID=UPI002418AC2A|nr:HNH endonuclease family protein [Isoptericola sp. AK164]
MSFRSLLSAVVACVLAATIGLVVPTVTAAPAEAAGDKVSARKLLRQLPVRSETNKGYDRSKFRHWIDTGDKDVCDTREEVLIAEAVRKPRVRASTCAISGGKWRSKYDGRTTTNKSTFDIDHVVPLKEAWASGAKKWTKNTRKRFANDLRYKHSLIAVSASSNRSKGSREPHQWMPPNSSYRCVYVKQWIAVKWRWKMSVNTKEKRYLNARLDKCKSVQVLEPTRATVKLRSTSTSSGSTDQRSAPWNQPGPDLDCSDIRKKVRVYPPDYHRLDADGNGWGCESYG